MKKYIAAIITLVLFLIAGAAHAAMITENYTGTITYAADGNVFGVGAADTFTWTTTYNLSYLATDGYLVIGDSEDMVLEVTIGSRTFEETEDYFYGSGTWGAPLLEFDEENNLIGISFLVDDYTNNYRFSGSDDGFTIYSLAGDGFTNDELLVSGTFSFSAVPVPAAAWLLGSGLLGLIGIRRRMA